MSLMLNQCDIAAVCPGAAPQQSHSAWCYCHSGPFQLWLVPAQGACSFLAQLLVAFSSPLCVMSSSGSSSSWAEEAQFTATLNAIKAPSGSKIKRIAELAVEHTRHYKHVVYAVERLIRKSQSTPATIAGLYCIDAIVRHSRHSHSSSQPDVYVTRFSQHLAELLLDVVERCGTEGKDAIRKLCKTWKARAVFDRELIDRMLDEVGDEEADEEGTEEERDRKRRAQAETDSEEESEEKKRPEPVVRAPAQPPLPRPRTATVPPSSQPALLPHPSEQHNNVYYPPSLAAPLLPTPSQPPHTYGWQQQQQQQSAYPPQPATTQLPTRLPSYAALLGDEDDDDEDDEDRIHRQRQRLEAEKLKLSQPPQPTLPTQPPPRTPPPQPPPQPSSTQPSTGDSGHSAYEYEQKRSRFGAPKSRDEVEAAMAAQGGPADGYREPYRAQPSTDFDRTPSNSFSPHVPSPPSSVAPSPSYAPSPPSTSSFDSRPRYSQHNSSTHPGLQLSSDQSNCPPGVIRVISTVLFIGHGKLETSSASPADWLATLTSLCQPHGQLAAIRYVPTAGAHFATFGTRGQAEAAVVVLQRQRVLDRELKLGWGKSRGVEIQRFDSETGVGFVEAREAERARLELWTERERGVSELMREQTEQRVRGFSAEGNERGFPSATQPAPPSFSPPQHYQPPPTAAAASQPFSSPATAELGRLPFHHPSRPPPAYDSALSAAAPSPKTGPSPSVAAFLASVLPPTAPTSATPSYAPSHAPLQQQQVAAAPSHQPLMPYPGHMQYPPPSAAIHPMPYVPAPASYSQNRPGGENGVMSDPWEARKRLRWDEGQQNYQQQQLQQQQLQQAAYGGGSGGYPPY